MIVSSQLQQCVLRYDGLRILITSNMRVLYISLLAILSALFDSTNGEVCTKDKTIGKDKAWLVTDNVDRKSGQLFMMRHDDYLVPCCGVISEWHIYIKNPGTIKFQIWRGLGTGEYTLVGENLATYNSGEEENYFKTIVDLGEQIAVKQGDFIGWYNENEPMVSYDKEKSGVGALIKSAKKPVDVGETIDWSTIKATDSRSYAMDVVLSKALQPKFQNLNADISIVNSLAPNTEVYKLTFEGVDQVVVPSTFAVSLDTFTNYFSYNASENSVFIEQPPPTGKYSLEFSVKDHCENRNTGKLTISVKTKLPSILNLPAGVVIREDVHNKEIMLKELDVVYSGPVVCELKAITPSSGKKFFLVRNTEINGTEVFIVYLKATARLDYEHDDYFELTIKCATGSDSDTKDMFVNIEPNKAPQFINLPSTVLIHADEGIMGGAIFHVISEDEEDNVIFYNMSCDPEPCPFNMTKDGSITVEEDLRGVHSNLFYLEIYGEDNYNIAGPEYLVVNITDGFNRSPYIYNLQSNIGITLEENSPPGTSLFEVLATDQDLNDNITFSLKIKPTNMLPYFSINETSGIITALHPMDYEGLKNKNIKLQVYASDGKITYLADGYIKVSVVDLNEPPIFSYPFYTVYVPEGKPGADTKAKIKAKDPDKNDVIAYSLDCGNETNQFQISEHTAEITQTYGLDVDVLGVPEHEIVCNVTATDTKGLMSSAAVHFVVKDADDNTPDFERTSYLFVATRDLPVFSVIGYAYATDMDTTSVNSKLFYYIEEDTDDFIVDDNGTIHLLKDLTNVPIGSVFKFTVKTEDGDRKHDDAPVTVVVLAGNYSTFVASLLAQEITFFDLPGNVAWFVTAMYLLIAVLAISIYTCIAKLQCTVKLRRKEYQFKSKESFYSNRTIANNISKTGKSSRRPRKLSILSVESASPLCIIDNTGETAEMHESEKSVKISKNEQNMQHSKERDTTMTSQSDSPRKRVSIANYSQDSIIGNDTKYSRKTSLESQFLSEDLPVSPTSLIPEELPVSPTSLILSGSRLSRCSLSDIQPITTIERKATPWKPWAISDFRKDSIPKDYSQNNDSGSKSEASVKNLNF